MLAQRAANNAVEGITQHTIHPFFLESQHPLASERIDAACAYFRNKDIIGMLAPTSWREAPGNNFHLTNYSNPFHMGKMTGEHSFPVVIANSCNTADVSRSDRPSIGHSVKHRMLFSSNKGADLWVGNAVGTYQTVNAKSMEVILNNLLTQAGTKPMALSIMEAKQALYPDMSMDERKSLIGLGIFGFVGHYLLRGDTYVGVDDEQLMPLTLTNHPNPSNPATTISFNLNQDGHINLRMYDIKGRCVRQLMKGNHIKGNYSVRWNGEDDAGRALPSGVYICRLETKNKNLTKKLVLTK